MDITSPNDSSSDPEADNNSETPLVEFSQPSFTPNRKPQILASLIVTIGAFSLGNALGWSSPALYDLKESGQLGELTKDMESWIGSIVNLGGLVSGFVVGYGIDRVGRKSTLLLISAPFVFGWVLLALSQNFAMMLTGRFVTGFCGAAFTLVAPVYIGEIAEARIRGVLSAAVIFVLVCGILFTYVVGAFVSWVWLSMISATIPIIFVCCMIFMPESPTYLVAKGKDAEASKVLQWLRGASRSSQIEAELIKIQEGMSENSRHSTKWIDLLHPHNFKPTAISMMLMLFQQLGGINAVIFYSVQIFEASGTHINSNLAAIIVGTTQVIMNIVSIFLVDRAGRKILLIVSDAGMAISLFALATFFYMKEHSGDKPPENLGWLPLTSLIFYMITYNIALGNIPWIMMGEILPPHIKGFTSALASSFCWTLGFIVTKNFGYLSEALGEFTIFCIFGAISVGGSLFALFIVPETKGKSLDEIQALFRR